ncbi:trypsin-like serine protease [Nannocystis sp. ncelm1]|uniref:Trypsin-like serine protease n=1 Tax=Nannocystis radixulma TaxID=2995305 RepID=A0ABT5B017_9BACT|nr:trypsin-like serine protease [Nannocystis radixulma]
MFADAESPGVGITNPTPDDGEHLYVGALVLDTPQEGLIQVCSGTLIAENVFLTVAHCVERIDDMLEEFPGAAVKITFDETISDTSEFFTGTPDINPAYNGFQGKGGKSDPGDLAVYILSEAPGIEPASLPEAGLLDELNAERVLRDTRFTTVGYGRVRVDNHAGPQGIFDNLELERNQTEQGFHSLTQAWLNLSMTFSTGDGGGCFGDGGGPHLIHLNGVETVVSLTALGDVQCKALDKTYRLDTDAAREFLGLHVPLP